jgi:hypothetical protein
MKRFYEALQNLVNEMDLMSEELYAVGKETSWVIEVSV